MASREGLQGLDGLVTESRTRGCRLRARSTHELVELMNREDAVVPAVVGSAAAAITGAIDAVVDRLRRGGRLIYVGAGTSGRIGALDAEECEATFSTEPGQVVALVAGGTLSSPEREAAEDDDEAGASAVRELSVGAGRRRRRGQRQRPDALRRRRARDSGGGGSANDLRRLRARLGAGAARRARDPGRRRPGVRGRLDAPEGRYRTEAGSQHDLDGRDDPAREDLRRPDGRRPRLEREARGPRPTHRRPCRQALPQSRPDRRSRRQMEARRSPSSRSSADWTRIPHALASTRAKGDIRTALQR